MHTDFELFTAVFHFPKSAPVSFKKQVYCFLLGSKYSYGKEMLSSESVLFPKKEKERFQMSNNNNNQLNIPQAREAMDKFKMQAAQEVGVNLTNGYNGHLTSREAGSVGGQMVKKMIEAYEQSMQ